MRQDYTNWVGTRWNICSTTRMVVRQGEIIGGGDQTVGFWHTLLQLRIKDKFSHTKNERKIGIIIINPNLQNNPNLAKMFYFKDGGWVV